MIGFHVVTVFVSASDVYIHGLDEFTQVFGYWYIETD